MLKLDNFISALNILIVPTGLLYFGAMILYPWIDGGGNWQHVQNVWDRWQSLNVGMLAFVSSVTAFNISRYNANKQRERDFLAARSFLPAALSELIAYFENCADVLREGWDADRDQELNLIAPELPPHYREVFEKCIRFAAPDVGDYLSKILVWLQIHESRLRGFVDEFRDTNYVNPNKHNILTYIYRLGELQAMVNRLFEFARGMDDFNGKRLDWDEFRTAYLNLNFTIENYRINDQMNLISFTERAIERNENPDT